MNDGIVIKVDAFYRFRSITEWFFLFFHEAYNTVYAMWQKKIKIKTTKSYNTNTLYRARAPSSLDSLFSFEMLKNVKLLAGFNDDDTRKSFSFNDKIIIFPYRPSPATERSNCFLFLIKIRFLGFTHLFSLFFCYPNYVLEFFCFFFLNLCRQKNERM